METKKIIDMHFHCLAKPNLESEFVWYDNFSKRINEGLTILDENKIVKALAYVLDERACRGIFKQTKIIFALMIDFRKKNVSEAVRCAKRAGFKGVKILTNEQAVVESDYSNILKLAREVEKQNMFLTICTAFGGLRIYQHDALALAAYLLDNGFKESLILAHAGSSRIKDAILLADSSPNVYLDTSFTVNYWRGSSVIDDLRYAVNRFPSRVFYGSDSPYIKMDEAYGASREMIKKLPQKIIDDFFYNNAKNFLKKYE